MLTHIILYTCREVTHLETMNKKLKDLLKEKDELFNKEMLVSLSERVDY